MRFIQIPKITIKVPKEVVEAIADAVVEKMQEREAGCWIWKEFDEETGIPKSYWCSKCNKPLTGMITNYCGHCGKKMKGVINI